MYFKSVEDAYLYFLVNLPLQYGVKEPIIWCNFYLSYKKIKESLFNTVWLVELCSNTVTLNNTAIFSE